MLLERLEDRCYPGALLAIGFTVHSAPRIFSVGPSLSDSVEGFGRSILAGDLQSVSFVRGLLYDLVRDMSNVIPGSVCREFVDDLSQVVAHKSRSVVVKAGVTIGRIMQKGAKLLDLQIADKSVLIPKALPPGRRTGSLPKKS